MKYKMEKRNKKILNREELSKCSKDELIAKLLQIEAHNIQLKNIISKSLDNGEKVKIHTRKKDFDFSKCHFRRILLRIMYFGWDYKGLAVQEDSNKTVEHHLFAALLRSCLIENREVSNYHRCGRTDKGVSSYGQVISLSIRSKFSPEEQYLPQNIKNEITYCKILNRILPSEIRTIAWMPVPENRIEYSARFDCKARLYKYYFPKSNLNITAMREACNDLIGSHDFRNLCKMDVGNGVTEFIRLVLSAEIIAVDRNEVNYPTSMFYLQIKGNAFLWHQIRCIFGVLLLIGMEKEPVSVIKDLLDVERNPRKPQYGMALDIPLNLFRCDYDLEQQRDWVYDEAETQCVIEHLQNYWTEHAVKSTMIKDCLSDLEEIRRNINNKTRQLQEECKEKERDGDIMCYTNNLLQGVSSKIYKPLLERQTCSSLEERVEYFRKRRKIEENVNGSESTAEEQQL